MATNRELRSALLLKMGWTKQTLSTRVQKKKSATPMSTEDATYLIAHECGVKIERYLAADDVARVRSLHSLHQTSKNHSSAPISPARASRSPKAAREIRFPGEFKGTNPLLSSAKLQEAKEMAAIFPLLHVLENSMRELIQRVMYAKYGEDWWNTQLTSGKLKGVHQTAATRTSTQQKKHFWHQGRGSHPIDYVDLGNLGEIIQGKQEDFFPAIIPDREWFIHLMRELEPSRNVVCHMNPLHEDNIGDVKSWFRKWEKTITAAVERGAIPAAAPDPR